jgi:methanogenic corrinoid protein MtbC1
MVSKMMKEFVQEIYDEIINGKYKKIGHSIKEVLEKGVKTQDLIEKTITSAMAEVINRFGTGKSYFPDLLLSAKTMKVAINILCGSTGSYNNIYEVQMMIMTLEDPKRDLGKYLVSIIAESIGIKVVDPDGSKDRQDFKEYNETTMPSIIGLSGQPSSLLSKASIFNTILAGPEYKDKASFIVFSPPVTTNCRDRMKVDIYSDFSIKKVKELLKILDKLFCRMKI